MGKLRVSDGMDVHYGDVYVQSGKIGVGTTSPADAVHVYNGDVGIENSSGRRYRLIAETNGGFTIRDQTAAATRININTSGTVTFGGNTAWHAGNDGSGSGLDADTLDGINSGSFLRSDAGDTATGNIVFSGATQYFRRNDTTNYTNAQLITESYGGSSTTAGIGFHISGSIGRYLYMNNVGDLYWNSSGSKIWHAGNDGSGSGLDADLLDGQHGSYYQNASNINSGTLNAGRLPDVVYKSYTNSNGGWSQANRNFSVRSGGDAVGLHMEESDGTFGLQLYGNGSQYGFLDGEWAAWDIQKTTNGQLQIDEGSGLNKVWTAGNDGSGSGLDADTLDGQHASAFTSSASPTFTGTVTLPSTVNGPAHDNTLTNVSSGAWHTIASFGGARSAATIELWDNESSRHNYVKAEVAWSYGHGTISILSATRHGSRTIAKMRLMYNSSDQTYGGARLEVYLENWATSYNLRLRRIHKGGRTGWGDITWAPSSGTVSGYSQYGQVIEIGNTKAGTIGTTGKLIAGEGADIYGGGQITFHTASGDGTATERGFIDAEEGGHLRIATSGGENIVFKDGGIGGTTNMTIYGSGEVEVGSQERFTVKSHSNGWTGGMRMISQDGTDTFQIHPDNNGYMYVDKNWYFQNNVYIGSLSNTVWHVGNDGSGSGLDADTLDGVNSGSFVRSDAADTLTGALTMNVGGNAITISSTAPQIRFNDTDHDDFWIHVNSDRFYVLADRDASGSWETPYPMELNASTNVPYLFGNKAWTAGNDGSGSGLDADTLDGVNSASFARSDAGTTYSNYALLQRFYSNTNMATSSGSQAGLECFSNTVGGDAFMAFHVGGDYATYFGLDGGTNRISTGGWSAGATSNTVWHAGSDGAGSGLDADTLDGQQGSYYAPNANIVHKNANTMTGSSFKLGFHSGSGGTTFSANHYSMGVDIANGSWSGTNYSDLIIGYHTGIRIGAGYSGIRFYDNSPTTDTNNDGNGNGGEELLMTIGGGGTASSGAHVTVHNNLTVNDNLYLGDGNDGYFFNDTNGRTAFAGGDFYIQNSVGNYYNYATNQYIGDSSGDNIYFRGNTLTGNSWSLSGAGALSAATITATDAFRADRFEDQGGAFFWREGLTSGRHRHLNLADTTTDPASVTDSNNPTGISWGQRTDNNGYYMLGLKGQYNNGFSNHSRLSIGWHTGVEIGASPSYGGVRFMEDSPFVNTTEIFGIGVVAGGHSRIGASKKLYFNNNTTYGIGAGGHNYNSGYFDTLESGTSTDPLELVYYQGPGVNIGQAGGKWLGCDEIRFNANTTNRKISSSTGFYSSNAGVRIHGNWNEFEVMGRVLDVSGSNCHFMDGYGSTNHASHYLRIGTGGGGNGGLSYVEIGTTLNVAGDVVAYYSDARLKQNVETIPNALEILEGIRGVTFEWNKTAEGVWKKKEGDKDFGMIAQEVDAVFPMGTVVQSSADINKEMGYADPDSPNYDPLHDGERDEPEYKTIKYDKMVTLAIQAIKEQQEQIEELKQQIKDLQGQK